MPIGLLHQCEHGDLDRQNLVMKKRLLFDDKSGKMFSYFDTPPSIASTPPLI